ncbi:hypothetical protein QUA79_28295 [Microcoleus sp. F8-D1]
MQPFNINSKYEGKPIYFPWDDYPPGAIPGGILSCTISTPPIALQLHQN